VRLAATLAALAPTACLLSTEGQGAATTAHAEADAGPTDAGAGDAATSTGPERCENDLDDDGDGLVDCADPDCAPDYECVDTPPKDWEGPLWIRDVAYDEPATPCRGGAAPRGHPTGEPNPPSCTECKCSPVTGATCDPPRLHCYYGGVGDCQSGTDDDLTQAAAAVACLSLPAQNAVTSCTVTSGALVSSQGACTRSGGELAPTPPVSGRVDACSSPARLGGCAAGLACARRPAPDYAEHGVCILRSGDFPGCPPSFPDERYVVWEHMDDDRSCETCACNATGASCAGGDYTLYFCDDCASCYSESLTSGCTSAGYTATPRSIAVTPLAIVPGTCTKSGGEPRGAVHVEGQRTFCCKR
jgi:hypothetical protein